MPPAMSKHLGLWALWLRSTRLRWNINTFKAVIKNYITALLMPWKFKEDSQIFLALIKQNNKKATCSGFHFTVLFGGVFGADSLLSRLGSAREIKSYGSQSDAAARHTFTSSFIWDAGSIMCMTHRRRAFPSHSLFWQESVFQPDFQFFHLFCLFWSSSLSLPPSCGNDWNLQKWVQSEVKKWGRDLKMYSKRDQTEGSVLYAKICSLVTQLNVLKVLDTKAVEHCYWVNAFWTFCAILTI